MNINPEFRRNLWLELTPFRLIGMPMILGALLFLTYLLDGKHYGEAVARTALLLFGLLAFLWGTRLASEALITEIRDHTWDSQRMSLIGPWSMTWGKLLGSTIYPWYGALICMLVYLTSHPALGLSMIETVVLMVGSGLLGQAIGLLSSLQAIRKNQRYGRFQTTAFLVLGASSALSVLSWPFAESVDIFWYGRYYPDDRFVLTSLVVFLIWAVFGIYRMIRAELQLRSLPWAWWMFVLFLMGYVTGFFGDRMLATGQNVWQLRLLGAFLITLVLAYGTAFSERKDPVALRRLLQYLGRYEWRRAMQTFPTLVEYTAVCSVDLRHSGVCGFNLVSGCRRKVSRNLCCGYGALPVTRFRNTVVPEPWPESETSRYVDDPLADPALWSHSDDSECS